MAFVYENLIRMICLEGIIDHGSDSPMDSFLYNAGPLIMPLEDVFRPSHPVYLLACMQMREPNSFLLQVVCLECNDLDCCNPLF